MLFNEVSFVKNVSVNFKGWWLTSNYLRKHFLACFLTIFLSLYFQVADPLFTKTQKELAMVLKPDLSLADNAFIDQVEGGQNNKKLTVLLDKELRAVMLRMMVQILEGYRSCLTIVRIHPKPFITFHKVISSIFEKCSILI